MSKLTAPKQLPAPASGAAHVPPALPRYRANWLFLGFKGQDLQPGDEIEATEEEAAPYVGNVLTRLEPGA